MRPILIFIFLLFSFSAPAQMTTRVIRDSLNIPWEILWGPDDHIWFTQRNGYVCRMEPVSGHIDTLLHETAAVAQGEGGMLGMALHPDLSSQPYVYVAYNYNQGGYKERVVRYTYSNNALGSPVTLVDNIAASNIHNGCRLLVVGDKLFITTGDAANTGLPQSVSSLNGKVLRINLDGSVPADNPIPGSRVWSWGHRNAQGLIHANGHLYATEHGPNSDDEINIIHRGRNYGWPDVRGFCDEPAEVSFCNDSSVVEPLRAWTPTIAVCGIDYYNHPMFPALQGSILMTTLKEQQLYRLKLNGSFDSVTNVSVVFNNTFGRLRDVCISPQGEIYISTSSSGNANKIIELYDPAFTAVTDIAGSSEIAIYPNPMGDYTLVRLPSALQQQELAYSIVSESGKTVIRGVLKQSGERIATGSLPRGVYHIRITDKEGKHYSRKILKQ